MSKIDTPSSTPARKGKASPTHRTVRKAVTSDLKNDKLTTIASQPPLIRRGSMLETVADLESLDQAVILEGPPVINGEKLEAYPHQDDVLNITNAFIWKRATGMWADFEPFLIQQAERFNAKYFDGTLTLPEIKIGTCPSPNTTFGRYLERGDHGLVGEIIINNRLFTNKVPGVLLSDETREGFLLLLEDILLAELIHAYCHTKLQDTEVSYRGFGPIFTNECNRIGALIKLPAVRYSKDKKAKNREQTTSKQWPRCVRPEGYYLGAVVPIPDKKTTQTLSEPPAEAATEEPAEEPTSFMAGVIDDIMKADETGPRSILLKLYQFAEGLKGTPADEQRLAKALIYHLRKTLKRPNVLPKFPKIEADPMKAKPAQAKPVQKKELKAA